MLEGRVAIVTGAGMGMGAATARLFAAKGARVMLCDIDPAGGNAVAEAIRGNGGTAAFVQADVSREDEVAAMVAHTVEVYGRLDCAVNNAAVAPDDKPIAEADMAQFDRVIAVDLKGVLLCMKYQIRQMLAQSDGRGAIVNIGSTSSVKPRPNNAAYVAAKHAVIGLTKSGAIEYADRGIRVNAVMPGAIDTPMIRRSLERLGRTEAEVAADLTLLGRLGKPEEVAEASLWLCSDAASFVTGHALAVDAGFLIR